MRERIIEALKYIEEKENVNILYAVESGSRAWGFPSTDSDWDVRFVYIRHPEWYLTIEPGRDVIDHYHELVENTEFSDPLLDITGWDLKKTMFLLRKSNPQLIEWLQSPIVYRDDNMIKRDEMRKLTQRCLKLKAAREHYKSMAETNFREFLQGPTVRYKKYLYVLRPLLAAKWVERKRTFPPMVFRDVMYGVLPYYRNHLQLREAIEHLLDRKRLMMELDSAPRDDVLHGFILNEMQAFVPFKEFQRPDPTAELESYFRQQLRYYHPTYPFKD